LEFVYFGIPLELSHLVHAAVSSEARKRASGLATKGKGLAADALLELCDLAEASYRLQRSCIQKSTWETIKACTAHRGNLCTILNYVGPYTGSVCLTFVFLMSSMLPSMSYWAAEGIVSDKVRKPFYAHSSSGLPLSLCVSLCEASRFSRAPQATKCTTTKGQKV
jgi:hypothetical protein